MCAFATGKKQLESLSWLGPECCAFTHPRPTRLLPYERGAMLTSVWGVVVHDARHMVTLLHNRGAVKKAQREPAVLTSGRPCITGVHGKAGGLPARFGSSARGSLCNKAPTHGK